MRRLLGRRASSRSFGPVGQKVLRSLRSSTTSDFGLREVPEAAVQVDREALDVLLASLRIAEHGIRRFLAAEEYDRRAMLACPRGRDSAPVHVLAPVHLVGIDDIG